MPFRSMGVQVAGSQPGAGARTQRYSTRSPDTRGRVTRIAQLNPCAVDEVADVPTAMAMSGGTSFVGPEHRVQHDQVYQNGSWQL